jgi:YD repeat-containing protein
VRNVGGWPWGAAAVVVNVTGSGVGMLASSTVEVGQSGSLSGVWTNPGGDRLLVVSHGNASPIPQGYVVDVVFVVEGSGLYCPGGGGLGRRSSDGQTGDPVSTSSGNMVHSVTDVELPAGLGVFDRTLNTADDWRLSMQVESAPAASRPPGILGVGWTSVLDARSVRTPGPGAGSRLMMRLGDGRSYVAGGGVFTGSTLGWVAPAELLLESVHREEDSSGAGTRAYRWAFANGQEWGFDADGRLVSVDDPFGPDVAVTRNSAGFPTRAVFSEGASEGWALELVDSNGDLLVDQVVGPFAASSGSPPADVVRRAYGW